MEFKPQLDIGKSIDNKKLMEVFRCGVKGGMRRSLKTNSLVLISHFNSKIYPNTQEKNGLFHYVGMGQQGDQNIEFSHNKTLYNSNRNGVGLYFFKSEEKDNYYYFGRVLLVDEPKQEFTPDGFDKRKIWVFPLLKVGIERNITDFLLEFNQEELINKGVLDSIDKTFTKNSVEVLINLMMEYGIDTLTGEGNWFLARAGYFHNEHSSGTKLGRIKKLITEKKIQLYDVINEQDRFINPYYKGSMVYNINEISSGNKNKDKDYLRIKSLRYKNDLVKGPIIFGNYLGEKIKPTDFYTSVLIGPNGTGKSMVISMVQKIFTDVYRLTVSKKPELPKELDYDLEYILGKDTYQIKQENNEISFYRNSHTIPLKKMPLPERVISCSFTIQDRFSILNENEQDIHQYEYFGIKKYIKGSQIEQMSNIVAFNIMRAALIDNRLLHNLKEMTTFLNYNSKVRVTLRTKNKQDIDDVINEKAITKKQMEMPHVEMVYAKDIDELIKEIKNSRLLSLFANAKDFEENFKQTFYINKDELIINFDLDSTDKYETFYDIFKSIWHLMDLELLISPSIMMNKGDEWFSIEKASSGEFQYLSAMINILANIKPNSLVLMDEPETSLHPTWQNQYMYQLQNIFRDFPSCHFLIATHSHFMVADLKPESSSIVTLMRQIEDRLTVTLLDEKTYGRSAEDILYNVFHLKTTRNYYIETDLSELLRLISNRSQNYKEIERIIDKLEKLPLPQEDPIKTIILSARRYIQNA
ncbi:AAA family ATPase [Priestia aryabhattai]|uniref:AAA family ATPase n=1 Tax=Priestia aryabhattai TaxID=412384 RepID=UPI002E1DEBEA|nr:AAA family ATPase [Priestia aryabhattai]MED4012947.1 AAA family ATPase [Priestia aryabhattai]